MNEITNRLGLLKPAQNDYYEVGVQNANMDVLDSETVRLYTTEAEPDDSGPLIWLQPVDSSIGLLTLGESAGEGLNVVVDGATSAVTNAKAAEGDDPLSFTIL